MPFVSGMKERRRLRTELGYSMTCHASMYTGVWPEQHLHWFIWQRNPGSSPFRWMRRFKADRVPDLSYTKYGYYRLTRIFKSNSAFFSLPFPAFVPLRHWHQFDVTEKRFWTENGFNAHYKTIFELLRGYQIKTNIAGMDRKAHFSGPRLLEMKPIIEPFTYLFFGDIDYSSHRFRHDSLETRNRLRIVDAAIEKWYMAATHAGEEPSFLLWSDHGHIPIERHVDPSEIFGRHGIKLDGLVHFVDSNFIRFWFRSPDERELVEPILHELGPGFIINAEQATEYHVNMPDNRYGDLIYYLDAPAVFHKGVFKVLGRELTSPDVSMHGYRPDLPESDGALVSNRTLRKQAAPILQDIPPTILGHYGKPAPTHMVGQSLW